MKSELFNQVPPASLGYLLMWCNGVNLKAKLPKSNFYRVKRQLLPFGFDISAAPVTRSMVIRLPRGGEK